jgi:membrane protease YdiL (CAAX protease family)
MSIATTELQPQALTLRALQNPRPWGFFTSTAWFSFFSIFAVLAVVTAFFAIGRRNVIEGEDAMAQLANIILWSVVVLGLMAVVWQRGWRVRDYFALSIPTWRDVALCVGVFVTFAAIGFALYLAVGYGAADIKTQVDEYRTIRALGAGALSLSLIYAIVVAPVAEEMIFRGFLYRGWSSSRLGAWGAIVLVSLIFGLMHLQYTWLGMADCVVFGLICGWLRLRTGSLLVPILLHVLNNMWATGLTAYFAG